MNYDDLLNRGKSGLPGNVVSRSRFEVPGAKVAREGKKTIVTNFADICSTLSREQDAVARYLLRELGTAGSRREGRLILNGAFSADSVNAVVGKYVESFVMCRECHLPDTRLQKEGRSSFIRCEACGAKYEIRGL